ncbi:MAG: YcxB family protein [Gammaproteobacteria bacterium]|jgi:hypothetical protein
MAEYRITEAAYVRANAYAFRRTRAVLSGVALLVPALALLVLGVETNALIAVGIVYALLVPFLFLIAPLINRWNFRRIYRKNPLLHKTQNLTLTDDAVKLTSENGESRYRLSELKRIRIYPDMVLIYPTTQIYHMLPRDVLTDSDMRILRAHAEQA